MSAKRIKEISVFVAKVDLDSVDKLRTAADKMRESGRSGICLIASIIDDKVQLVCSVTDDLKDKYPAGKLVGLAAKLLGGGGGGKSHLATAGGKDISKLDDLIQSDFYSIVDKFDI